MAKPTILLVPGAWHPVSMYTPLLKALQKAGYPTEASNHPSFHSTDPENAICAADAIHLRDQILKPLVEQDGKDIVMVAHSYGSMPATAAAYGFSKSARQAAGQKGGVMGLILIAAFVVDEGKSVADACGGDISPWVAKDKPTKGLSAPQNAVEIFAADVDEVLAEDTLVELVPFATKAMFSPQPPRSFAEPESSALHAYVMLLKDAAIPAEFQQAMLKQSGEEWIVRKMDCSHDAPFMSKVPETLSIVDELIGVFQQALMV